MTPYRTLSIALAAVLLGAFAQVDPPFEGGQPLPPTGPTIQGEPPLASMEEYRGDFSLRGPGWVGDVRTGRMRIRIAGEPDRIVPLTDPMPCFVRDCVGARWEDAEGSPAIVFAKASCDLGSGGAYPYGVKVILRRGREMERVLKGCALSGRAPIPGPAISQTAAPPPSPPRAETAADARKALDDEAGSLTETRRAIAPRDWHELNWIGDGDGAAGRLHDLCTGAVEPKPKLSIGRWDWETLDPRTLNAADRQIVLQWRAQRLLAGFACGTVFQIGSLGSDARKAAGECPADISVDKAFADYVSRKPELRRSNDPLKVATEALREGGCR